MFFFIIIFIIRQTYETNMFLTYTGLLLKFCWKFEKQNTPIQNIENINEYWCKIYVIYKYMHINTVKINTTNIHDSHVSNIFLNTIAEYSSYSWYNEKCNGRLSLKLVKIFQKVLWFVRLLSIASKIPILCI